MRALIALFAALAGSAAAAAAREVCPSFAGLDTGTCTTEPGRLVAEITFADATRDRQPDEISDRLLLGRLLLRTGLGASTEAQVDWQPHGIVRTRDRATGAVERRRGAGDLTLGLRHNLRNPNGEGTSFAVQPFLILPVGRRPVGTGDWGAGVILPLTFSLSETLSLTLDPEADALVDEDGAGRHLRYGGVISLALALSERVDAQFDYESFRDRQPGDHATSHRLAGTLSWQPDAAFAAFVTAAGALDRDAPDAQVFIGVARRF